MSLVSSYVPSAARQVPAREALIDEATGLRLSYREFEERTSRIALGLMQLGLRPGDRMAYLMHTSIEYVELYVAALRVGVVVVPINVMLTALEVRYILEDARVSCLAYDDALAEVADAAGALDQMTTVRVGGSRAAASNRSDVSMASLRDAGGNAPRVDVGEESVLALGFTSGTTGFPKAALLTHAGVSAMNRTNALGYRLPLGSRGAYAGNMSFTSTVPAFLLTHFSVAGTVVLAASNEPSRVLRTIESHGCNYTSVVPPLVAAWADAAQAEPARLASLVSILQGAGPAPLAEVIRLNDAVGGRVVTGWGMTEASGGLITALTSVDALSALQGRAEVLSTVGQPLPGLEVRLAAAEADESELDDGIGELLVRGPSVVKGYWQRAEATAAAYSHGWYRTGDLGRIDDEGRVILVDRRSDLIVTGGLNVYPGEIERVLRQMPGVRDCAVVGVPHERWGRAVAAVVVAETPMAPAAVVEWCRAELAGYKKPVHVAFTDELPRTVSGKVRRHALVQSIDWGDTSTASDA